MLQGSGFFLGAVVSGAVNVARHRVWLARRRPRDFGKPLR
jgi:hypothetical protein